ncbi:MAG: hypothetical protein M1819_000058 [Sarea resinae]|nr:MAG: hypothetical protein M1819_000058 [Sarea resinae]
MPRPAFPPTPGSSTDIAAKDNPSLALLEGSFALLPPAAIAGEDRVRSSSASTASNASSVSSYRPVSPSSPEIAPVNQTGSRRRAASGRLTASKDDFALPPPPTRPRKIIQMKMKPLEDESFADDSIKGSNMNATGKKKQPSSTSAAGRKIARKTAHSLIERRRRSKMNEEFAVLKDMIPACQDQEMHKLAILQASIEYLRYLETCVTELKANPHARTPVEDIPEAALSTGSRRSYASIEGHEINMTDCTPLGASPSAANPERSHYQSDATSPVYSSHSKEPTPALEAQHQAHHHSYSSSTTSTMASPVVDGRRYSYAFSAGTNSALTSPALKPQAEEASLIDHEATRALLMLNADRRYESSTGRGMSVRDLLSG